MMEYIIAAVVLAVAVGAYFYMKRKEEKEPEVEKMPWEQPKPKRPNQPPPQPVERVLEDLGAGDAPEEVEVVDDVAEKERLGELLWGNKDLHIINPHLFELTVRNYNADPAYPPFNDHTWTMSKMFGKDCRPSYATIEAMKNATGKHPADDLKK